MNGFLHELGEVHRAEQAGAVRRQRLFAARVGGADVLAPPVIVHLVDLVDQDETRFGIVIGGCHDQVPEPACRDGLVDLAGHLANVVGDVALGARPVAPDDLGVRILILVVVGREHQIPRLILFHRLHELVGNQARQIELTQAPVLALGADEVAHVRMSDVEGAHLRAAPAAGRGHGEAHGIEDIHERQRTGGIGAGATHERALRAQGGKFIADAAARFQRESGLVHTLQNAVHRIRHRTRDRAVDGRGLRFVLQCAGIRCHAPGRDCTVLQCPQELVIPLLAFLHAGLDISQGPGDTRIGTLDVLVEDFTGFGLEAVFFVPDVVRGGLQRNFGRGGRQGVQFDGFHFVFFSFLSSAPEGAWFFIYVHWRLGQPVRTQNHNM